jgi:hypothetical protein
MAIVMRAIDSQLQGASGLAPTATASLMPASRSDGHPTAGAGDPDDRWRRWSPGHALRRRAGVARVTCVLLTRISPLRGHTTAST